MKNLILPFFLILALNSFAQNIRGKIFSSNKTPLLEANIFFDGTTIKTISDENGNFTLNFDADANNILVVSFMGYQTEYISNFDPSRELIIYLKPQENILKEVVILKDKFTRNQKLQLFREQFLGLSPNGKLAVIRNEDEIYFKYDKKNYVLTAYSDVPLIIINPTLGYRIEYNLENFEVKFNRFKVESQYVKTCYYTGFSSFKEINNASEIIVNRQKAFHGSEMNFFRSLKNNGFGIELFSLMVNDRPVDSNNCFNRFTEKDFTKIEVIPQEKDPKNLNSIASYDILYDKKEYSNITFVTKNFKIYKYGNYSNIKDIVLTGKFSENRMGDMLPLNYNMK